MQHPPGSILRKISRTCLSSNDQIDAKEHSATVHRSYLSWPEKDTQGPSQNHIYQHEAHFHCPER